MRRTNSFKPSILGSPMQTDSTQPYAQYGEDVAVLNHFGAGFRGIYAEVGAFLPDKLSQSYLLEQDGWTGILVEPQPDRCRDLREKRNAVVYQVACGSPEQAGLEFALALDGPLSKVVCQQVGTLGRAPGQISVQMKTLDELLEASGLPHVHFLSIDTEGFELNVLKGFTINKYRPELIIIEDEGESLANYNYLVGNGYRLVKRTGCNDWYVPLGSRFSTPTLEWLRLRARTVRSLLRSVKNRLSPLREMEPAATDTSS